MKVSVARAESAKRKAQDEEAELSEVQNSCCTFVPRKPNKRIGLEKVMLSTAYKNKWEGNWLG